MASHGRTGDANGGRQRMPAGLRGVLFAAVALVVAGALYLIAVRGEALLADLTTLASLCF